MEELPMEVLGLGGQRGGIGGCGGGELEHPRQLRGTQWPGLFSWEQQAAQSRQAHPGPMRGTVKGGT